MVKVEFLTKEQIEQIHTASLEILDRTGIMVRNSDLAEILANAGCDVDSNIARIPSSIVEDALNKVPNSFELYSQDGEESWTIGGNNIIYNPGSSVSNFLDRDSGNIRKANSIDLIQTVQVTNATSHIGAQSTAIIPSDIPESVSDFYRLFLVLKHSNKPVITGAFRKEGIPDMLELLYILNPTEKLSEKPTAIFDCCPTSPLTWSDTAGQNLVDCAKAGLPAEIVPAPLIGATSPITISGTLAQIHAEILSGIVVSQLLNQGTPVIYGGAPSPLDMRYATPRFGSIESLMTVCASAEMGKHYKIPTHAYLGISDSKTIDAQLGFESAIGIIFGAITDINIVSGPGTFAYINCLSLEKLIIDNEMCGTALRMKRGLDFSDLDIVTELISAVGHSGDFLKQRHTAKKLREEHFMPSSIIDRLSYESWVESGERSILDRAKEQVNEILQDTSSPVRKEKQEELGHKMKSLAEKYRVAVNV